MTSSLHNAGQSIRATVERYRRAFDDVSAAPTLRLPEVIQFPVNNICNSRCVMCDIWMQKRSDDITPEEVRKGFASPLFAAVRSVGVNGGEPTLRKDLPELVGALAASLPSLQNVHLITNAIRVPDVVRSVEGIVDVLAGTAAKLHVMVSLDGLGEVHDRVRGRRGNFASAVQVLDRYQGDSRLGVVNMGCTISRPNAEHVDELLWWAVDRQLPARFRVAIPHQRLYSNDGRDIFALTDEERHHVVAFLDTLRHDYEREPSRAAFYLSLRNQLAYGLPRSAGCPWKNHGATVLSNGDLAYCAVASPVIGNVRQDKVEQAYWSSEPVLQEIRDTRCDSCQHDYTAPGTASDVQSRFRRNLRAELPDLLGEGVDEAKRLAVEAKALRSLLAGEVARRLPAERKTVAVGAAPRILLTGWYGTETLGDKAILAGVVLAIRDVLPGARLTIASLEPWVTVNTQRQMPELADCEVVALRDAPALVKQGGFDAVFVAGGPMMAPVAQVVDLALLQQQARAQGLATGLLGCGIGPMGLPVRDLAIRELVASSDICLVRDAGSAERCSPWRPDGATTTVVPDPAMIWLETLQRQRPASPRWGFALRRFPHAEYARERSEAEALALVSRFESEVRRCVSMLLAADPAAVVVPFPMHRLAVGGDDRPYLRQLFASCERVEPMVWRHRSPADDAADFASLSGLLGMRFHSLVFALGLGVPLTAVDYTAGGKSAALLHERGLADALQPFDGFDGARAAEQLLAASRPAAQERADAQAAAARSARATIGKAVAALVGK